MEEFSSARALRPVVLRAAGCRNWFSTDICTTGKISAYSESTSSRSAVTSAGSVSSECFGTDTIAVLSASRYVLSSLHLVISTVHLINLWAPVLVPAPAPNV